MVKIGKFQVSNENRIFEFESLTIKAINFDLNERCDELSCGEVMHSLTKDKHIFGSRRGAIILGNTRSVESLMVNGSVSMFIEMNVIEGDESIEPNSFPNSVVDEFQKICTVEVYDKVWDDIFGNVSSYFGFSWGEKFDLPPDTVLGEMADA